ncbi:acyl-CoA N-acyltransferase [Xylariaceae sp. FL1651]|nr:acyl-CoA N-acyltransferase [Xylariaceae sp. FL1651]
MAPSNNHSSTTFIVRSHRPDDIGMIISRHGVLYARDFGWGTGFEAATARLATDLIEKFDPNFERVFIAESNEASEFLGSVALIRHREELDTAQLRLLLVEPAARGTGLGARLIKECIIFAQEKGYTRIVLWTYSILEGARRLYKRAGFQLVKTDEEQVIWDTKLVKEIWELALSGVEAKFN